MTTITISDGVTTLSCVAIRWREEQICNVGIRGVPTRNKGATLDIGTYVLKPRTITMRAKFSDGEKTDLMSLFLSTSKVTITAGNWSYTAWLRTKRIIWEYNKQSDADRPWVTTLTFDCESFTYTGG